MATPQPAVNQQIICPVCQHAELPGTAFCGNCGSDLALTTAGNTYYLTKVIKQGGQGAVFVGTDLAGRTYAIKMMLEQFTTPEERQDGIERFQAEAKMLQRLRHPRIPRVYASFEDDERHYLVMDFVRGEDLAHYVERVGPVPEAQVLRWAEEIGEVLAYLHGQQPPIVFRDIKPSNIMLEAGGDIKLIDFGIAKALQSNRAGTQIGTPGYAPPEQYQGFATPASDIFALCATLHHLLSGRDPQLQPPFSFPPLRSLAPAVSERTAAAITRGLQFKPEDRFASVAEFLQALKTPPAPPPRPAPAPQPAVSASRSAAPAQPQPAQPQPAPAQPQPAQPQPAPAQPAPAQPQPAPAGSRRGLVLGAVLALLAIVGGAIFFLSQGAGPPPQDEVIAEIPFDVPDLEIIVPNGTDEVGVQAAFQAAYLQKAREQFPGMRLEVKEVGFVDGRVERLASDAQGTRYRASLTGTILGLRE